MTFKRNREFTEAYSIACEDKAFRIPICVGEELFLEGDFFYRVKDGKIERFKRDGLDNQLRASFLEDGLQTFIESVEGVYAGILVDKKNKKITAFSDKLKRREIYYYEGEDEIVVSTHLKNLRKKSSGYNPKCIMSLLYLYIPKGHTLHDNIFRLRYNEVIEITDGSMQIVKYREEPLKIQEYDNAHLKKLVDLLENAIISRASDELNIVQLSGGWDSTFLISVLVKHFGKDKVKAAVMELILPDGRTYNPYEVEKCKKISEYFGIDLDVVKVHFGSNKLVDLWKQVMRGKVADHELYNAFLFTQFQLAEYIKKKYGEKVVVFNGEACDSVTNFGFAQYHSITHDHKGFCEYADKMMCYLYSPTFFKKVLNNTYEEDFIFKMFKWYFKNYKFIEAENLSKEDRILEYFISFVYAAARVPFMELEKSDFINDEKIKEFKEWLKSEYFEEVVKNVNPDNLYYWLLRIYLDFHLQSPGNIRKVDESLSNVRIPFLDYSLFKFFAQMPENWGRSLDINNVKYPLKRIISDGYYRYPTDVIAAPTPHSYTITEADSKQEFIHNSALSKYFLTNERFEEKCARYFAEDYFNTNAIMRYVNDFKGKKIKSVSRVDFNLLNFLMQAE